MSSIDERIVAMRFDNGQFEKGVKQSMRTLQELREATNLDDVAASMGDVSKSINQNLQFQNPTKSAGIFSKALTSLGKVAKTTFNAATFPLQALGRSLQNLGKYTRAVLGIDIASQLVHTGEQVIRAFTIDPLKSGWNEYELKMDSIKTIMTGTIKSYTDAMTKSNPSFLYDEETHLEYVKRGLEELNTYADKTIYSFQDMTTNIGKFTNAGIDFETSVSAIKGVANIAAYAGQGAAQASSAMYNFAQSLGVGHLERIDWKSIENAQMATPAFKQTMIDLGIALGTLKKEGDQVYALTEKGLIDKNTIVTAENLRDTLTKSKWVTNDVLLGALSVFSGEYSKDELKEMFHIADETAEKFYDLGQQAAESATQVRTFTKMWDALKEAAQSGWAISWELVFGDLNEATEFWTNLNNRFSALLDRQAKSREDILRAWRGQAKYWDPEEGAWTFKDHPEMEDGRKILIDALNEMLDTIREVGRGIGEAWTSIFGTITGQNLLDATKKLKGFTKAFSDWLGKGNDKNSRISKLTTGLKGIFSVLKGAGSTVKGAITTISQTLHLDKLLDAGISVFGKAGEWLGGLGTSISGIWESIGQTEIMQKLSGFFEGLWGSVSKFFTETNSETGNTGFVDWLHNTVMRLEEIWTEFTKTDFYVKAGEIWGKITDYFTPKTIWGRQGKKRVIDSQFVSDIKTAFKGIEDAWKSFTSSEFVQNAISFFTDLWGSVSNFFFVPEKDTGKTGFAEWFGGLAKDIEQKWTEFTSSDFYKNAEKVFAKVSSYFSPRTIIGTGGNTFKGKSQFEIDISKTIRTITGLWTEFTSSDFYENASTFFSSLWLSVSGFFTEANAETGNTGFIDWINGLISKLQEIGMKIKSSTVYKEVEKFFNDIWAAVSNFVTDSVAIPEGGSWQDSPIGKAITSVGSWIQEGWNWIEKNLGPVAEQIGGFLANTFDWIMGKADNGSSKKGRIEIPKNALKIVSAVSAVDFSFDSAKVPEEAQQNKFLSFFTNLFGTISEFVGKVKDWQDWDDIKSVFTIAFTGIVDAIKAFAEISGLTTAPEVAKALTSLLEVIAKIVAVISKIAVAAADAINGKATSEQITTLIETVMGIIAAVSTKLIAKDLFGGETPKKSGILSILGNLTVIVGWITLIGLAMWALEEALEGIFGKEAVEKIPEKIKTFGQIFTAFGDLIGEIIGSIFGGFEAGKLKQSAAGMSQALLIAGKLSDDDMQNLERVMGTLKIVSDGLPDSPGTIGAWFGHKMTLGEFAGNIEQLGQGLQQFSTTFKEVKIDPQALSNLPDTMAVLKSLSTDLPPDPGILGKWFGHEMTLGEFGTNMAQLGSGLKYFSDNAAGITDFSYVTSAIDAISSLVKAAATIALLDDIGGGNWNAANYVYQMTSLIGGLNNVLSRYTDYAFSEEFEPLITFGEMFDADIKAAADSITIEPIIQSVLAQLSSGKARISEGFGDMFPTSVRPAYDVDNETNMPLLAYQNGTVTLSGTVQIDTASLSGVIGAINSQGSSIVSAIQIMGNRIDNVASAVKNMKLVLDTGVLAGSVDAKLGANAVVVQRTGSGITAKYNITPG